MGRSGRIQIYVATLGFSNAIHAEASWTQGTADWIASNDRALIAFGGVPEAVVPDNLKSAVTKADRYEPALNAHAGRTERGDCTRRD